MYLLVVWWRLQWFNCFLALAATDLDVWMVNKFSTLFLFIQAYTQSICLEFEEEKTLYLKKLHWNLQIDKVYEINALMNMCFSSLIQLSVNLLLLFAEHWSTTVLLSKVKNWNTAIMIRCIYFIISPYHCDQNNFFMSFCQ